MNTTLRVRETKYRSYPKTELARVCPQITLSKMKTENGPLDSHMAMIASLMTVLAEIGKRMRECELEAVMINNWKDLR